MYATGNHTIFKAGRFIIILLMVLYRSGFSEADTRSVKADFDRCTAAIERTRRELQRLETTLRTIEKKAARRSVSDEHLRDLQKVSAKFEYLKNRIDRTAGQRDKITTDLRNLNGPTCPSCVNSSVDLYCRNSETIRNQLDAVMITITSFHDTLCATPAVQNDTGFTRQRATIAQQINQNKQKRSACSSTAGKTLWKQCYINLKRADSLYSAGALQQSKKTLVLVELLMKRALIKCSEE